MIDQVLRVGVVGCGRIATGGHVPALKEIAARGGCTIVGVCDTDRSRSEDVGRRFAVPFYYTLAELIEKARPDVVSIATLPPSHRALTLQALDAGCHVLCEKPIAMNLD